jgi:hypothetical protein
MVPEDEKEGLVSRLTDTLQPALEEYITMRVNLANFGVVLDSLLDYFSPETYDDLTPDEPVRQNPQWSEAALKI